MIDSKFGVQFFHTQLTINHLNRCLFQNNEELKLQVENLRSDIVHLREALEEKDAEMAEYMSAMGPPQTGQVRSSYKHW